MTTITPNTATTALEKLFEEQVAALHAAGLAAEAELTALFPLLEQIGKVTEGEGRIPFVIVVQRPELTLSERMAKVVLEGKSGVSHLADSRLTNVDDPPQGTLLGGGC